MAVEIKDKELLSVREVTQITGWSRSTVYQMIKNKQLPTVKFDNSPLRIHKKKFLKLINGDSNE